jgi:hypothetical protein
LPFIDAGNFTSDASEALKLYTTAPIGDRPPLPNAGGFCSPPYGSHALCEGGSCLIPVLFGELFSGPPVQLNLAPEGPDGKV